jgi:hypothetical protein
VTRCLLPLLGVVAVVRPLLAQAPSPPAYSPLHLDGATYRQEIRSVITVTSGRERSRESSLRDGRLRLVAAEQDSLLRLEAWFDTLVAWREGAGGRLTPETDGVIGGRFRGLLSRQGGFQGTEVPFVPDDLAQVAELTSALADLLPPLPPVGLLPGGSARDDFGTAFLRAPDALVDGKRVERYRLVRQSETEELTRLPDSSEVRAQRRERENGVFSWSPELGLVRWEREVTVEVLVPVGGVVRQPFRTVIEQTIVVERTGG